MNAHHVKLNLSKKKNAVHPCEEQALPRPHHSQFFSPTQKAKNLITLNNCLSLHPHTSGIYALYNTVSEQLQSNKQQITMTQISLNMREIT